MMTWMKRFITLGLAVLLALGLAACASKRGDSSSSTPASHSRPEEDPSSSVPPEPEPPPYVPTETEARLPAAGIDPLTGLPAAEGRENGQRPVAVMVVNSPRAMPQRGLDNFQLAVELPVVGGHSNMMAFYSNQRSFPDVGPVGPMTDAFLQMAMPLGAIPVHIDATQYARNLMTVAEYKSIDGFYVGASGFWFDQERTLPRPGGKLKDYSWFTNDQLVVGAMEAAGIPATGEVPLAFNFAAEPQQSGEEAMRVEVRFGENSQTTFNYDTGDSRYYDRIAGNERTGVAGERPAYDNLFMLAANIAPKEDSHLLEVNFVGGEGWYFTRGVVKKLRWEKGTPTEMLRLYDEDGTELKVNTGVSYIGFVPVGEGTGTEWFTQAEIDAAEG